MKIYFHISFCISLICLHPILVNECVSIHSFFHYYEYIVDYLRTTELVNLYVRLVRTHGF